MLISERHNRIIFELQQNPQITVRELSQKLHFSEPTIRRDLTELHRQGILTKHYGGAILNQITSDREIPSVLRENEKSKTKAQIGLMASELVSDGMILMLDGSTSAYHLVPYLAKYKDITVVTSGAKTAVALAELDPGLLHRRQNAHQHLFLHRQRRGGYGAEIQRRRCFFLLPGSVHGGQDERSVHRRGQPAPCHV